MGRNVVEEGGGEGGRGEGRRRGRKKSGGEEVREGREKGKERVTKWTKTGDMHDSLNTLPTQTSPHTSHTHSLSLMSTLLTPSI